MKNRETEIKKEIELYLKKIIEQQKLRKTWDLETTKQLLKKLENPQLQYPIIHITGTNGKGSTVAFLNQILREAGYQVGMYTSPHFIKKNERIRVNNAIITDEILNEMLSKIKAQAEQDNLNLSFFEAMTISAFLFFAKENVDIAILEVGMGGVLDATNACESIITTITSIAKEHTAHLGTTLKEIAENKAGIIKEKQICVIPHEGIPEEAKKVIAKRAEENNTKIIVANPISKELKLKLRGDFQKQNAGIAKTIAVCLREKGFKITDENIVTGMQNTIWHGRLEWLTSNILIDAAHNPHAIEAILPELKTIQQQQQQQQQYKFKKTTLVLGFLEDKDYEDMLSILLKLQPTEIILTEPASERACPTEKLVSILQSNKNKNKNLKYFIEKNQKELWNILKKKPKEELIIVTGSMYVIGEMMKYQENNNRNQN